MGLFLMPELHPHLNRIGDAVKAIKLRGRVHISNTFQGSFRHQSYISGNAKGVILGWVEKLRISDRIIFMIIRNIKKNKQFITLHRLLF
jgi:3-dehydroquinate dehydratase